MKIHNTQRLFWKQWPIKAVIEITPNSQCRSNNWRTDPSSRAARVQEFRLLSKWCKEKFPNAGMRKENNLSLFLNTEEELEELLETWAHKILEIWKPENDRAKELLMLHSTDIIRSKPWYGKYSIRARILYSSEFKSTKVDSFKTAVRAMDPTDWHCAGVLKDIITKESAPKLNAWGQPMHLYLRSADDAAMLRLQVGDCIERFERIRKP